MKMNEALAKLNAKFRFEVVVICNLRELAFLFKRIMLNFNGLSETLTFHLLAA